MDTVSRLEEMQQMIRGLKEDNNRLQKRVKDAEEESWFKNLNEGRKFLQDRDNTVASEMDNLTKEEVISSYHIHIHSFHGSPLNQSSTTTDNNSNSLEEVQETT